MARPLEDWQDLFGLPVAMSVRKTDAGNNDKSVADTVALMGVHAANASRSKQVIQACKDAGIQAGDNPYSIREKIFSYIKSHIRFVQDEDHLIKMFYDPNSKELLITPQVLLSMNDPSGDCDDFSMLTASMLMANELGAGFVTIAADASMPEMFSHVYVSSNGISMDSSHGREVGWETSKQFRKQVWPILNWGGTMPVISRQDKSNWLSGALRGLGLGDMTCDESGCYDNSPTITSAPVYTDPTISPVNGSSCVYGIDANGNCNLAPNAGSGIVSTPTTVGPIVSSSGAINWNNILPGLFASTEKIAQQISQPAGYQITNPNGQTISYVAPSGTTTVPSISSFLNSAGGLNVGGTQISIMPLLLIGVAIFVLSEHQ